MGSEEGRKRNYLNKKYFLLSVILKMLRKMTGHSINGVLKMIVYVRVGHCVTVPFSKDKNVDLAEYFKCFYGF